MTSGYLKAETLDARVLPKKQRYIEYKYEYIYFR